MEKAINAKIGYRSAAVVHDIVVGFKTSWKDIVLVPFAAANAAVPHLLNFPPEWMLLFGAKL
jgi:hypothetical protein